jgi:hypothetical protein
MLATFKDPDFLAAARKESLEINKPTSGASMQAQIARVYAMPPRIVARLRKIAQNY